MANPPAGLHEYVLQGSVTDAVIAILTAAPEVQAFGCAGITRNLVGYDRADNWIVVNRQGGSYAWPQPPHPRIDIECYAPQGGVAEDMIETVIAVMFREQSNYVGHGVRLCAVKVETSPFEASDKLASSSRFLAALRLTVKPA